MTAVRGRLERLRGRRMLGGFMIVGGCAALGIRAGSAMTPEAVAGGAYLLAAIATLWMVATDSDTPPALLAWQGGLGLSLGAIGGILLVGPATTLVAPSITLGTALIAAGLIRGVLSLTRRRGWAWMTASAAVSAALGLALLLSLTQVAAGQLAAIDLIAAGIALILRGPGRRIM